MHTKLKEVRVNKSPHLPSYQHTVSPKTYVEQCLLCLSHTHDTNHIFNCSQVPTQHNTTPLVCGKSLLSSRGNPRVGI